MTYQTIFTLIGTWIVLFLDVIYFGLFWRRSDWRAITKIKWPHTLLLHLDVIAFLVAKTTKTADLYNRSLVVKTIAFLAPFTHLYHGIPPQKWTLSCLGYDIAKQGENKQNGRHGGISLKPSGTIYRPAKFFFALPFQEKWYTGNEGKNSKRRSLRNMFFLSRKHDFSKERSKLKFKLYTVSAKGLLASYIIVFSASFPTITPASNKIA